MISRLKELEVPNDAPFTNDKLDRQNMVQFLGEMIESLEGPYVIALNSPWGTGKSTFVRMLQAHLEQAKFECLYFNAWEVDYLTDPLVALVARLGDVKLSGKPADSTFKNHYDIAKKITTGLAKRTTIALVKAGTQGLIDVDAISDIAAETTADIVDAFREEKKGLDQFRSELEKAIAQLDQAGKKPTLVFFIDELDRCRPSFAIQMLERIKHLFNLSNIIFVLSIDKGQLEASTQAIYGENIKAAEYLRRFFDIEYILPPPKGEALTAYFLERFQLDSEFNKLTVENRRDDRKYFVTIFTKLADATGLSARDREQCLNRLAFVMRQVKHNELLYAPLMALLIVLRTSKPDLFEELKRQRVVPRDAVMEYLKHLPDGSALYESQEALILEIGLIYSDSDKERRLNNIRIIDKDRNDEDLRNVIGRATRLMANADIYRKPHGRGFNDLTGILNKIDLANNIHT